MVAADPIDDCLDELAELLARMARVKAMGVRPVGVRQAVLDVCEEIRDLMVDEE